MRTLILFLFPFLMLTTACSQNNNANVKQALAKSAANVNTTKDLSKYTKDYFASGCFWCVEGVFESVKGVEEVISGYSGGHTKNPTYEEVGSKTTGHAEAVEVYYDPAQIDYATLLKVYFNSMDPTQVNGQGPDRGTPYRSIIFYRNEEQRKIAQNMINELNKSGKYDKPIAVEVKKFEKFWNAEDYHQNYIYLNPGNPYVQHESIPRIQRFQRQFPELVKPEKN
ncbi:MAG: peptide-methionine (S)-S-oxide reductase MsrA, partial [Saprospiraceae bacterium]